MKTSDVSNFMGLLIVVGLVYIVVSAYEGYANSIIGQTARAALTVQKAPATLSTVVTKLGAAAGPGSGQLLAGYGQALISGFSTTPIVSTFFNSGIALGNFIAKDLTGFDLSNFKLP